MGWHTATYFRQTTSVSANLHTSAEADQEHHFLLADNQSPGSVPSNEPPLVCPDTLDEMLQLCLMCGRVAWMYCGAIKFIKPPDPKRVLIRGLRGWHVFVTLSMLPRQYTTSLE